MKDTLAKLFSSGTLIKVMRLFLLNRSSVFDAKEIATRVRIQPDSARYEINLLRGIKFIVPKTKTTGSGAKKRSVRGWQLDAKFPLLIPLEQLLFTTDPIKDVDLVTRLRAVGKLQLVLLSGVFVRSKDARVDLLIVADHIKKSSIEGVIRGIEAEIGKELEYVVFTTKDFLYRQDVKDGFVRDIFDGPYRIILSRLGRF